MPGAPRAWYYRLRVGVVLGMLLAMPWSSVVHSSDRLVAYQVVNRAIPQPLTAQPGDPEHGRRLVLEREAGDCTVCHAMPLPQRQFHGTIGPPLDGVGERYTAGELRLRLVDPQAINPQTIMPAYYKVAGLQRVLERYRGKPVLTAQQIEDVVAYLLTLK
jgi:sulfur-oxidizing protein SoxX